ncbi:hypothetical protein V491_07256 [Pseudogymnoascus sp. VKM F-3775]|nr:hypothetical protein V491_07256 [Pseudogymnoascus sp. VKM F-3775]
MDDPWGSPWADEAPGTTKKLDEARPKPIVIATEKELPFDSGPRSPWDDDQDDENWSANLDRVVQEQHSSTRKDVDAGWSYHQSNARDPLGKNETVPSRVDSPWAPHSHGAGESPKQNLQIEGGGQSFDDPWAQLDTQIEAKPSPVANTDVDSYQAHVEPSEVANDARQEELQPESSVKKSPELEISHLQNSDDKACAIESPNHEEPDAYPSDNGGSQPPTSETQDKDAPQSSRSSSSLSEHSHHHETTSDSPHTSPDGESRHIPVEPKDTSKVKDLVQLFDGLAVESPSTPERRSNEHLPLDSSEPAPEEHSPAESEDEFGDFEDGVSFVSTNADSDEPKVSTDASTSMKASENPDLEKPIISRPEERRTFERGSVNFDIDKSIVDRLFLDNETLPKSTNYGPSDIDNPTDSLLTVEQRKVWYRISRYGTMRKHNSGDDDAYVRMGWQHSKVREKTLDIVHKWMEEGRLGAGMTLGVGRVEAMFSWGKPGQAPNSEALPVTRKASQSSKAKQPALHTSPPRESGHDVKPSHKRQKSSVGSIKSIISSPIEPSPRFSWSSAQPASPGLATAITPVSNDFHPESLRQEPVIPPISKAFESPSPVPVPIEPLKPKPAAEPPAPEQRREDVPKANDDDDEWGEMVASPATPNFPVLSGFPSSQVNAPPNPTQTFSPVGTTNNHVRKHFRNTSLGNQLSGSIPPKPFDMDDFVPKASNRSSLGDLSKLMSRSEDPWANADFSMFESPSTAPTSVPSSKPPPYASKPSPIVPKLVPVAPKDAPVSSTTKLAKPTSPQTSSTPPVERKSKAELEQDKIVRDIINGLPDLSYMLR